MNLQIGVKVIIENDEGQLLFLERSEKISTDTSKTSWDIPGGRINPDEPLLDALKREITEEIGFDISSTPELLAAQDIFVASKKLHVVRLTYTVHDNPTAIHLSDEHISYKWIDKNSLSTLNTEPYLTEVLTKLL